MARMQEQEPTTRVMTKLAAGALAAGLFVTGTGSGVANAETSSKDAKIVSTSDFCSTLSDREGTTNAAKIRTLRAGRALHRLAGKILDSDLGKKAGVVIEPSKFTRPDGSAYIFTELTPNPLSETKKGYTLVTVTAPFVGSAVPNTRDGLQTECAKSVKVQKYFIKNGEAKVQESVELSQVPQTGEIELHSQSLKGNRTTGSGIYAFDEASTLNTPGEDRLNAPRLADALEQIGRLFPAEASGGSAPQPIHLAQ